MTSLRKLQLTELNILKKAVAVFDEMNIPYVALGGTLLGAVRHGGFIPWDDDIDLGIPREYYDEFIEKGKSVFNEESGMVLKNFKIDSGYKYYFSRITDKSVKVKDGSALIEKEQDAWIDIFPIDGMPKGRIKMKIHKFRLLFARMAFQYSQFSTLVSVNLPDRPWYERLLIKLGKILPVEKMFSVDKSLLRLDKLLHKYPYEKSFYAVNFMGAGKFKEMHERSVYDNRAEYKFEDTEIYGVKDYDKWLRKMYGDYNVLPPEENRNKHFTEVIGCENEGEKNNA